MTRRFFTPEVVQSSAMDCGPAALKCLLEGFGVSVSYGRLREACQTDVDGTSIDTLEDIAPQLGLAAEQIMVPVDHLLLPGGDLFPAIVVVQLAAGLTHFVVAWRRHGPFIQLMDPGVGRRWVTAARFREEIYQHTATVAAGDWREWAASDASLDPLRRRLAGLGVPDASIDRLIESARSDASWRGFGALDAATRMTSSMVAAGGPRRGSEAERVLHGFIARPDSIPPEYWSVRPGPPSDDAADQLRFRGAVLLRATGLSPAPAAESAHGSPEIAAALHEKPAHAGRELLKLLRASGILAPASLLPALLIAAAGVILEALLFRGIFDLGRYLAPGGQRIIAMAAIVAFTGALLLLEFPIASGLLRLGRALEVRLRLAFLQKIPLLGDRYFQSRLTSDMAERSHSIHQIRHLPELAGQLARSVFELLLTVTAIVWLDPRGAPWAIASATFALLLPLLAQPPLMERDLRVRSHLGALSRFYLDALLGLVPIRTHAAERAVRREHEGLLVEWARAGYSLQRVAVAVDALQFLSGFGLAAALLFSYEGAPGTILLLVYWALNLPVLGQEIALVARQYPTYRNLTLRLLEPLGALEEQAPVVANFEPPDSGPASIALENVTVRAAGHTILENIDLDIPAGSHVAIVGPSGAGKSSLVGLLLGWHRAAAGSVTVDGRELDAVRLDTLRSEIAWVDPAVQLWNRSLAENLTYGLQGRAGSRWDRPSACQPGFSPALPNQQRIDGSLESPPDPLATIIDAADLRQVLANLPAGADTPLGEGGALVSGGEGQRVRLARALLRPGIRIAILDEPFRGLSRDQRRELLSRARRFWKDATLICITHDVGETLSFPRVLVIDDGKLIEDGAPGELAADASSRYRSMLDADGDIREGFWSDPSWRHVRLEGGVIEEQRGATWAAS